MNKVKELMQSAGLTQASLAQMMGVTRQAVHKWVNEGVLPSDRDRLRKLAEVLKVQPETLLFGEATQTSSLVIEDDDYVLIPHLDIRASCGTGIENFERPLVKLIKVAREWLRIHAPYASIKHLHIIMADGDSMSPSFESGDMLLVDTSQTDVRSDAVFVFRYQSEIFVKRIQRISHGLRVLSDNPAYPPFEILDDDTNSVEVIGRIHTICNFHNV